MDEKGSVLLGPFLRGGHRGVFLWGLFGCVPQGLSEGPLNGSPGGWVGGVRVLIGV